MATNKKKIKKNSIVFLIINKKKIIWKSEFSILIKFDILIINIYMQIQHRGKKKVSVNKILNVLFDLCDFY